MTYPEPEDPDLLLPKEAAEILRVSRMTIYRMIRRGDLASIGISEKQYRIKRVDLDAYLEKQRYVPPTT